MPRAEEPYIWQCFPETQDGAMIPPSSFRIPSSFKLVQLDFTKVTAASPDEQANLMAELKIGLKMLQTDAETHQFGTLERRHYLLFILWLAM